MDFVTTNPGPVGVKIDGVFYQIPRLLLPEMAQWMEELVQKQIDRATKHLDDDSRARFLLFFAPPMFDVADVATDVRTPDGVQRLLRRQLSLASPPVPEEVVDKLIKFGDPDKLRNLAEEIASSKLAEAATTAVSGGGGEKDNPLAKRRQGSAGSRSTGSKSKLKSLPRTLPSTKND